MSAPLVESPAEQDLLDLLELVDESRARAFAAEEQFRADIGVLYAERMVAVRAERDSDESSPLLNAAFLASVVVLVRRALDAGAAEGARFAYEQFDVVGVPSTLIDEIQIETAAVGDKLVADFLAGQVEVARDPSKDLAVTFKELLRRAELAVVSALQTGRGVATDTALAAASTLLGGDLHKLWVARFDLANPPCKMCVRLHGQHVPLGQAFDVPKEEQAPYLGTLAAPPRHPNCRCSLVLYLPPSVPAKSGALTPLSMQAYASWALSLSDEDRSEYLAATVVHVKGYTRMVDGKLQHVSGYYYNIQSGQKIPEGQWGSVGAVKQVSSKQAKQLTQAAKTASKAAPKSGGRDLKWKPGTYKVDLPGGDDDTQVVVHKDGSSTSIHKGRTEDADSSQTAQFLSLHQKNGSVQKISDDPDTPDSDGPGPALEPGDDDKKGATLAEGWYVLENHPSYGGVRVDADGNGKLYFKDFKKSIPLKEVAISQIAKGHLGEFQEVEENEFTEDWVKNFNNSKAGGAKPPRQKSSTPDAASDAPEGGVPTGQEPGDRPQVAPPGSPNFQEIPDVALPGEPPLPDTPERMASGIVVMEPDGSVWIYEPKGHYADYEHTWPKGGFEAGLTPQQNAHKELFEEVGVTADITGYLGDYKRSGGGMVRMYVATRKGGDPKPDDPTPYEEGGSETATVKNVSLEEAAQLLNVNRDKRILKDVAQFGLPGRPPGKNGPTSNPNVTPQGAPGGAPQQGIPGAPQARSWDGKSDKAPSGVNVPGQATTAGDALGRPGGAPQAPVPQGAPNAPAAPQGAPNAPAVPQAPRPPVTAGPSRARVASTPKPPEPSQNVPERPEPSQSDAPETPAIPEAPEGGPGDVVKGGPSLFSVGEHSVEIPEGAQVYKSSKSKDTLYVLNPDGDLIKYNPQGAGVQATKVGSSENPAARAQQLAKLRNVTDEGISIKNTMPAPGTGKALVGGFEMTSKQLGDAIAALSSNPSGNVAADLKKAGSPLAAGKFHQVAAPYKAYYNNKTKPALIAALKKAQQQSGYTPASEAPAVAHLAEAHGLEEHHASLGHADTEAIHAALHAVDPQGSDHSHANDGPGFISVAGTPFPPASVAQAIDALKKSPTKETGVKKPLKAAGSPLANLDLQGLANNSSITEQYKGSNGKVHYGKLKPAVIALLTEALDQHQTKNPPSPTPAAVVPDATKSVQGVQATQAEIKEMQDFFGGLDLDAVEDPFGELSKVSHNPLSFGVDWDDFVEAKAGPGVQTNQLNEVLHKGLNDFLDKKTPLGAAPTTPPKAPDTSPALKVAGVDGTVDQLQQYKQAFDFQRSLGSLDLPRDNKFSDLSPFEMADALGVPDQDIPLYKAALSDALQKKIDQTVLKQNLPPATAPDAPPATISVGGKQVSKADLLAAVEAVKNSPSTGVKGPLKSIDSPLSKVDIKAYIESDPLSDPYKGSNGKVHYGKLKDAVASVLQAKADSMADAELPDTPAVTPAGDATPEVDAPSVAPDAGDFFADDVPTTPTSGNLTPDQKLKASLENAEASPDIDPLGDDSAFANAFQQAVKEGKSYFTDEEHWSSDADDFMGGWYYEVEPNGNVYEIGEDGGDKKLSTQQVLNLLGGKFDNVGGSLEEAEEEANLAEEGFYTSPAAGLSLKVYTDGSGLVTNLASGEQSVVDSKSAVKNLVDSGGWTKVSDTPDEIDKAHVEGVEVGHYPGGSSSAAVSVYPDGTVLVEDAFSATVMDAKLAKPYLKAKSSPPQALLTDPPDWVAGAKKGPGGLLQGEYDLGGGEHVSVGEDSVTGDDGLALSPEYLASLIFNGDASYMRASDAAVAGLEQMLDQLDASASQQLKDSLVAKAKAAADQDPWALTTTPFSLAFQTAVKSGSPQYMTAKQRVFSQKPADDMYMQFSPDGSVVTYLPDGSVVHEHTPDQLAEKLDGAYNGPSVLPPTPPAPDTADEVFPDGTWMGNPVGTYTNGEGQFVTVGPDGPELSDADIDDGLDGDLVLDMIGSGDLTWVPPQDSPVSSSPGVPPGSPKLSPIMTAGYVNLGWLDKPQLTEAIKKWASESDAPDAVGQHLGSAKKEDLIDWIKHWSNGDWDKAYEIESKKVKKHKGSKTHPGSPDNPVNAGGFQKKVMAPYVDGELPAGVVPPGSWPSRSVQYSSAWDADTVDAYLLAANMQNPTGLKSWKKKDWVNFHINGNKMATDSLSYLAQKNVAEGDILSDPILPPVQKYGPGEAIPMPSDFPEIDVSKSAASNLTNKQLDQYINHLGNKSVVSFLSKQKPETKQAIVALHAASASSPDQTTFKDPALAKKQLKDLLDKVAQTASWNEEETTSFIHNLLKVEGKTFTMDKDQPPLAGHSTIYHVSDEQGNKFLFKVAPENFRAEIEHAAHELAQLSGLQVAESLLGKFNGKFGQFQAKIPSQSTLHGVAPTDLSVSALKDLMRAHVQDYVTSNDDAHDDNFLLSPDGKRVIPIDIARAYVRFGKPGAVSLKLGALSNWETPYYQKVYDAVLSKKLSDADVDELYAASMKQARRTQGVSDESWSSVMAEGLKNRTNFGWTSAKNREELIQQALARKNGLEGEFEQFWDGIYSKLGREKPASTTTLAEGVHSGFTPQYLEHVNAMGNHGAATFFGGTALEEGFMLGQVFNKAGGAGQELHLSGQLLRDADKKLTSWLKANQTSELSGATGGPDAKKAQLLSNLDVAHFSTVVVAAAKTISHHHKQGDQSYNTSHMANFESVKADVAQKIAQADAGNFPSVISNWPEAQTEYKNLLSFYDAQIAKVQNMKDMGGQSKIGDYPEYDFQMPPEPVLETPIDLAPGLKVVKMSSYFEEAELGDDGKLTLNGSSKGTGQTGKTYQVELSDGTVIEYRSWAQSDGVAVAQQGHIRIKVRDYDGTSAGVDAARSALSNMGVDLNDATEEDLELFYYRHLYAILQDRKDRNEGNMGKVTEYISANLPGGSAGTPALSAAEELKRWREGWSRLDKAKFNTFLAEKKWMPRFHRANPVGRGEGNLRGGQPYWERFDVDRDHIRNLPLLQHSLSDPGAATSLVKSGGLLSTEQRTQVLGKWLGGMSSGSDQMHGSSNYVFTRQNQHGSFAQVYISPEVLTRTTNYAFGSDNFGEMKNKKTGAYFDLKKASAFSGGGNELMIKRMLSLMDDIEMIVFKNEAQRQEALDWLKSHGVTVIRGLAIEQRLVLQADRDKALAKIQKHRKTWNGGEEAPDGTGTANFG